MTSVVERDLPLQSLLPASYRPGQDDIAPYVQAAMSGLVTKGRASVLLPPGRHRWNSSCYLDAATRDLTYELRGYGKGTVVELGPGLGDRFAIHLNENRHGKQGVKFPRHPRLRISDMYVTATDPSIQASLCYFNEASVDVERVRFTSVKYGLTGSGYTDLMTLRQIGWELPAENGRLYLQNGTGGDGLVIEQVTATIDSVVAELNGCNGATISSCIGGRFIFTDCDAIEVIAFHHDSRGGGKSTNTLPIVLASGSRVAFRGGWNHVGDRSAAFEINDADPDHYSELTWDGYSFAFRAEDADKQRAPDVRVVAAQDATKLRFRGCSSRLLASGNRSRWAVGPNIVSDDREVQAAIDAVPTAPLEDSELLRDGAGWAFRPAALSGPVPAAPLGNPQIEDCSTTRLFPGSLASGTYYYTLAAYGSFSGNGPHSATAPEASTRVGAQGSAVALRVRLGSPRAAIRVWRGRSPGQYDSFANLVVGAYSTLLVDTGPYLCGSPWAGPSVPPLPANNNSR